MISGRAILLGAVFAIYFGTPATSATIKTVTGKNGRVVIQIAGQIEPGDTDALLGALRQTTSAGKIAGGVQLNSTGGGLVEGARLASVIKGGKLAAYVGPDAVCASACFLAFAAGNPKFAAPGALIGVHKASDRGGRETPLSGAATHSMARFARELGVPSSIINRMVATSAKQIAWLDPQELRAMGVTTTAKPVQTLASTRANPQPRQIPANSGSSATLIPNARVLTSGDWVQAVE